MVTLDIAALMNEEFLRDMLERFRALGPFPGIALTFMKSFVPQLPTVVIVGLNAAVYGLWLGFLYSWIGLVTGCVTAFLLIRKAGTHPWVRKWAEKPRVARSMEWVRRNGFMYVFLLSLFPVGPFVVINFAAGLAGMKLRPYLLALGAGRAIMVLAVSYIGNDLERFIHNPIEIVYVAAFILLSLWAVRAIEARFAARTARRNEASAGEALAPPPENPPRADS